MTLLEQAAKAADASTAWDATTEEKLAAGIRYLAEHQSEKMVEAVDSLVKNSDKPQTIQQVIKAALMAVVEEE